MVGGWEQTGKGKLKGKTANSCQARHRLEKVTPKACHTCPQHTQCQQCPVSRAMGSSTRRRPTAQLEGRKGKKNGTQGRGHTHGKENARRHTRRRHVEEGTRWGHRLSRVENTGGETTHCCLSHTQEKVPSLSQSSQTHTILSLFKNQSCPSPVLSVLVCMQKENRIHKGLPKPAQGIQRHALVLNSRGLKNACCMEVG